jgi:pyruvate/2-oxoglutarate dehydrogenase complex dihydrolipoamide acyltransferase (E2) component
MNDDGVRLTEKLWTLNPAGLAAAAVVLDRQAREMGGTARTAASGAKHARVVTDVLDAFLQRPPEPTQPVARKALPAPAAPSANPAPAARPGGWAHSRPGPPRRCPTTSCATLASRFHEVGCPADDQESGKCL